MLAFLVGAGCAQGQTVYGIELDSLQFLLEEDPSLYHEISAHFLSPDTAQEFVDLILLYYGSAYQVGYNPYGEKPLVNSIWKLLEKEEYDEALQAADGFLNDEPANLTVLRQKAYAWLGKDDSLKADLYFHKYYQLLAVPFHSGDGKTPETAYLVRSIADEYAVVDIFEGEVLEQNLVSKKGNRYDVMEVKMEGDSTATLWFNINLPFTLGLMKMFESPGNRIPDEDPPHKKKGRKRDRKK